MLVEVTQEDIEAGTPWKTRACPLARALSRAVGQPVEVLTMVWCLDYPSVESTPLPRNARDFNWDICHGEPVKPFRFRTRKPRSVS